MPLCHYCQRHEATAGYPDIPASQHCDGCSLVRMLSSSVSDIRCRAKRQTNIAVLAAAMRWEHTHANRGSVIVLIGQRAKAIGYRLCACGKLVGKHVHSTWCPTCAALPRNEHGLPIWPVPAISERDLFQPRDERGHREASNG